MNVAVKSCNKDLLKLLEYQIFKKKNLTENKQTKKKDIKYIHHLLWMKNNNSMVGSHFSPQLYVTFWALSMFDLYVPSERYEQELNKLKQQQAQLDDNKDMVSFIIKQKVLKSLIKF